MENKNIFLLVNNFEFFNKDLESKFGGTPRPHSVLSAIKDPKNKTTTRYKITVNDEPSNESIVVIDVRNKKDGVISYENNDFMCDLTEITDENILDLEIDPEGFEVMGKVTKRNVDGDTQEQLSKYIDSLINEAVNKSQDSSKQPVDTNPFELIRAVDPLLYSSLTSCIKMLEMYCSKGHSSRITLPFLEATEISTGFYIGNAMKSLELYLAEGNRMGSFDKKALLTSVILSCLNEYGNC